MDDSGATQPAMVETEGLQRLIEVLAERGYRVVGPTLRDNAIVLAELDSADDLPRGWGVDTAPGQYRVRRRSDAAAFGHSSGPQSWKQFLHPPRQRLWSGGRGGLGGEPEEPPRYAFLGVRGCDLAAIATLDRVLGYSQHPDSSYVGRRRQVFVVAVNCTGPLARFSLNSSLLSPIARQAAAEAGLAPECRNPFRAIVARAVEVVYAVEEALRIIDAYERPARPFVDVPPRRGVGHGVSEAPRGLLYHRYEVSDDGPITTATIVPPTSQNQGAIEADMANLVTANLNASDDQLTDMCEKLIRTYDPCISCSTHFLTLTVRRM